MNTSSMSKMGLSYSLILEILGSWANCSDRSLSSLLQMALSSSIRIVLRNISFLPWMNLSRLIHPNGTYALEFGEFGRNIWHLLPTIHWNFLRSSISSLRSIQTSHPYVAMGAIIDQDSVVQIFMLIPFLLMPTLVIALKAADPYWSFLHF